MRKNNMKLTFFDYKNMAFYDSIVITVKMKNIRTQSLLGVRGGFFSQLFGTKAREGYNQSGGIFSNIKTLSERGTLQYFIMYHKDPANLLFILIETKYINQIKFSDIHVQTR